MNKIKMIQLFFKKYVDKIRIHDLFNICLLLLEERKLIDIVISDKDKHIIKLLNMKYFKYNKSNIKIHGGINKIRITCVLSKNKKILNKFKMDDLTKFNHKLYGQYLEKDFYKCKFDKNTTHYISIKIRYITSNKINSGPF